jgi:hypothetical protein
MIFSVIPNKDMNYKGKNIFCYIYMWKLFQEMYMN